MSYRKYSVWKEIRLHHPGFYRFHSLSPRVQWDVFFVCSNQGNPNKTHRMRWISGLMPVLSFFQFPHFYPSLTLPILPVSPCFTTSFPSCCGDRLSLFCPSQRPLLCIRFKHLVMPVTRTAPSGQLSEQQQVTLHVLLCFFLVHLALELSLIDQGTHHLTCHCPCFAKCCVSPTKWLWKYKKLTFLSAHARLWPKIARLLTLSSSDVFCYF